MRPSLLLLLALVSAGCAGTAGEPAASAVAPAAPAAVDDPVQAEEAEPHEQVVRLEEQGRLGPSAMVCPSLDVRAHCVQPVGPVAFGVEGWLEGHLVSLDVTLTWTPSSALSERLTLTLGGCTGTPEDYVCETLATIRGTGPLTLRSEAAEGMAYFFVVADATTLAAGPAAAQATLEQPVQIAGDVRWRPTPS